MRIVILIMLCSALLIGCGSKQNKQEEQQVQSSQQSREIIQEPVVSDSAAYARYLKISENDSFQVEEESLKKLVMDVAISYSRLESGKPGFKDIKIKNVYISPGSDDAHFYGFRNYKEKLHEVYASDFEKRESFEADSIYYMPDGSTVLISLSDFLPANFIFVVFKKQKDNLIFIGILDTLFTIEYGDVEINSIKQITNSSFLIVGSEGSSDGGDVWGSEWYFKWSKPNIFTTLFKKEYSAYFYDSDIRSEKLLDAEKGIAIVNIYERKFIRETNESMEYGEWEMISSDTLNYMKFF